MANGELGNRRCDRRDFIKVATSFGVVAAMAGQRAAYGNEDKKKATSEVAAPNDTAKTGGLLYRGVDYDVGTTYLENTSTREVWNRALLERDFDAIRDNLHCNSISIFGTQVERLIKAASVAAERGLHVWIQPRPEEATREAALANLVEVAKAAERLRAKHDKINLNLGCELTLFQKGFIPGKDFLERINHLSTGGGRHVPEYCAQLEEYLKEARALMRKHFGGPLTYGAGPWEWDFIDWSEFDFISIDHYMDAENETSYVEPLRELQRFGKPLIVGEFGCCTFEGAEKKGGMGWDIIDLETGQLKGNPVRSEKVQADYITKLLKIFQEEKVVGAFVYQFMDAGMPYSPNPKEDLDAASYGIVKVLPTDPDKPEASINWEPKMAFQELAAIYGKV